MAEFQKLYICDDYGLHPSSDRAIDELVQAGAVSGFSAMMALPEGIPPRVPKEIIDKVKYGLHLNFTEGKPLSGEDKVNILTDSTGDFWPLPKFLVKLIQRSFSREALKNEIEAQIERFLQIYGRIDHIDGHQHIQYFPYLNGLLQEIIEEKKLSVQRLRMGSFMGSGGGAKSFLLNLLARYHTSRSSSYRVTDYCKHLVDYHDMDKLKRVPEGNIEIMLHVAHPDVAGDEFNGTSYSYDDRCQQFRRRLKGQ